MNTTQIIQVAGAVVGMFVIFFIIFKIMTRKSRKEKRLSKIEVCEHQWKPTQAIMVDDKIRLIWVCEKCKIAIHAKVYSQKELEDFESRLKNE